MHHASQTHALSMLDACSVHAVSMHVRVGALAIEGEGETEALQVQANSSFFRIATCLKKDGFA